MNHKLSNFLATGEIPTSSKERNLLLDLARLELSQKYTNQNTTMLTYFRRNPKTGKNVTLNGDEELANFEASLKNEVAQADLQTRHFVAQSPTEFEAEASKIKAAAAKARAVSLPPRNAAKTPAPIHRAAIPTAIAKPTPGLVTAAAFAKPQMTMLRSEWQGLSEMDKSRFFAEGGKLAQDPEPAKPLCIGGQLTRAGLRALSPQAQNAYFANGNRLAE